MADYRGWKGVARARSLFRVPCEDSCVSLLTLGLSPRPGRDGRITRRLRPNFAYAYEAHLVIVKPKEYVLQGVDLKKKRFLRVRAELRHDSAVVAPALDAVTPC